MSKGNPNDAHQQKAANEGNRNRNNRDDGGAPSLQEQDDHDNNKADCFEQRADNFIDRLLNELRRIVNNTVVDTRREVLLRLLHRRLHACRRRQCIGTGTLKNDDRGRNVLV